MIIIYSRFTTNYPSILFNMILFVYRDCVCVILLWIMTPKVDDSLKANLWINCKKDNQCVLSWKKMRSDDCAKIWNFLDSRKALSQRRGTKPSKLLKKICVLFDMWKYNYAVENVQRVDCWYVKLIWFRKLRFVMLELDSEMEDIQL